MRTLYSVFQERIKTAEDLYALHAKSAIEAYGISQEFIDEDNRAYEERVEAIRLARAEYEDALSEDEVILKQQAQIREDSVYNYASQVQNEIEELEMAIENAPTSARIYRLKVLKSLETAMLNVMHNEDLI